MKPCLTIALFDDCSRADHAMDELLSAGFEADDLSVAATQQTRDSYQPQPVRTAGDTAYGLAGSAALGALLASHASLVGPSAAGEGWLLSGPLFVALYNTDVDGEESDITESFRTFGIDDEAAKYYRDALAEGGVIIAVHADDAQRQNLAHQVLNRMRAERVAQYTNQRG